MEFGLACSIRAVVGLEEWGPSWTLVPSIISILFTESFSISVPKLCYILFLLLWTNKEKHVIILYTKAFSCRSESSNKSLVVLVVHLVKDSLDES